MALLARRPALVALLALGVAGVWLLSATILGGKVLSSGDAVFFAPPFSAERPSWLTQGLNFGLDDLVYLFHPHLLEARRMIHAGQLPLWDPYIGGGRPLGGQQGGPFYPVNALAYVLPFWQSLAWIALAKLLLAGLGAFAFARALRLGSAASVLCGLAFAFSTVYVVFLGHGQSSAFALAPWLLWGIERLVFRATIERALWLALFAGAILYAGHPETEFLAGLLALVWLVVRLVQRRRAGELNTVRLQRRLVLVLAGAIAAAAIGALTLVSFLEILRQSFETSRGYGSDSLRDMGVGLFFPELWGRSDKVIFNTLTGSPSSSFAGRTYIGSTPLLVGFAGLWRRPDWRQWFFIGVALISLLAMISSPVHTVLRHVPLFDQMNLHEFIWPLTLALAMLAGLGLDRILSAPATTRRGVLVAIAVLTLVPALFWLAGHSQIASSLRTALHQVPTLRHGERSADAAALGSILRWVALGTIAFLAVWRLGVKRVSLLAGVLVAVAIGDLVTMDRGYQPAEPQALAAPRPTPGMRLIAADSSARFVGLGYALAPDLAERYRLRDARVEDLPELERYTRLFTTLGGVSMRGFGSTVLPATRAPDRRLLDLFGVRYVLDDGHAVPGPSELRVVYQRPGERVRENVHAFPRAWVAYSNRTAPNLNAGLAAVAASSSHELLRTPIIEGAPASASSASPTVARVTSDGATRVAIDVTAQRPGYLILDDIYYPGWQATVDGARTAIVPANVAFRAVAIPAGHSTVIFRYRALSIRVAAVLSAVAVVASVGGLLAFAIWRRRRR